MNNEGERPKTKKVKVKNFWKRYEQVGELVVGLDDGQDMPPTLPDGTPLLTKAQKMAQDFDKAGKPMKGARDD